eukprot:2933656-Prymnesium_polylepis.1
MAARLICSLIAGASSMDVLLVGGPGAARGAIWDVAHGPFPSYERLLRKTSVDAGFILDDVSDHLVRYAEGSTHIVQCWHHNGVTDVLPDGCTRPRSALCRDVAIVLEPKDRLLRDAESEKVERLDELACLPAFAVRPVQ